MVPQRGSGFDASSDINVFASALSNYFLYSPFAEELRDGFSLLRRDLGAIERSQYLIEDQRTARL